MFRPMRRYKQALTSGQCVQDLERNPDRAEILELRIDRMTGKLVNES